MPLTHFNVPLKLYNMSLNKFIFCYLEGENSIEQGKNMKMYSNGIHISCFGKNKLEHLII